MASKVDVGKSKRTPAKHALLTALYGREVGSADRNRDIGELLWLDLTAGDGLPSEIDREWHRSCSPGILAYLARYPHRTTGRPQARKPTRVVLYERQVRTFEVLLGNLAVRLPEFDYVQTADATWTCGPVALTAINADGATATANLPTIRNTTAVMVSNDPNAIVDWAMPPGMPDAIRGRTPWSLGVSTMGCNPAGLKRLDPEIRDGWYDHVGSQVAGLRNHHDLFLAAIERDDAQWAYLVAAPQCWRVDTEACAAKSFASNGMTLRSAWLRTSPVTFREICHVLFKTKKELGR